MRITKLYFTDIIEEKLCIMEENEEVRKDGWERVKE